MAKILSYHHKVSLFPLFDIVCVCSLDDTHNNNKIIKKINIFNETVKLFICSMLLLTVIQCSIYNSLGPLVNKVKEIQVEIIVETLCNNMLSDKEQLRDISSIGMYNDWLKTSDSEPLYVVSSGYKISKICIANNANQNRLAH